MTRDTIFEFTGYETTDPQAPTTEPWTVLSVDDNADYQAVLSFALAGETYAGQPIELLTAQSAAEAAKLLARRSGIAVVLLDVVMEADDAGLRLVGAIRSFIGNDTVRIVLLTGQPGMAPQRDVMAKYDIDEYWCKSEMSSERLLNVVRANLRTWHHLEELKKARQGLAMIVSASRALSVPRDIRGFGDEVLRQIAKITDTAIDGIVCVRLDAGEDRFAVASSMGSYASLGDVATEDFHEALGVPTDLRRHLVASGNWLVTDNFSAFRHEVPGEPGQEFITVVKAQRPLLPDEVALLRIFNENVGTNFANVALFGRVHELAYTDRAIGCHNRHFLLSEIAGLAAAERAGHKLVMVLVDQVRDMIVSLGAEFLQKLLQTLSSRLKQTFPDAVVARISENGFCLLMPDAARVDADFCERYFAEPLIVDGARHLTMATVSVLRLGEFANSYPDQVLSLLESGASSARRDGKRFVTIHADYQDAIASQYALLADLRTALRERLLTVWMQPKVRLSDGKLVGMEALVRWQGKDGGMVPPGRFLPVATTTGLIEQIDWQVLDLVCEAVKELDGKGISVPVAFNASLSVLVRPGFFDRLLTTIRAHGISPHRLELEITESESVRRFQEISDGLKSLIDVGMGVSIDDFGTGYSSLSYITRLTATTLKVDRVFVARMLDSPRDLSLVASIIDLGRRFDFDVVVEGVETEPQRDMLLEVGAEVAQGYLFAKPMPVSELVEWATRSRRDAG
ncbi:MAG: EAL domain-containing protein [Gammaproteobacteria bacterium]|nr:EAL domain-containing protein [Gammaproteobacteria bacterium]